MNRFDINTALSKLGIAELNEMQAKVMDIYPKGNDIVLLSATGSGKTLAYLLPLMCNIDCDYDRVQAVVLVPSRELAMQIDGVVKTMKSPVRSVCCYGGRPAMDEHRTIMGVKPHIVIATPGRMNDHLQKRNIEVDAIRTLVIDEFDKCLELGFQDEMKEVIEQLPLLKRRFLLSATDAPRIPDFVHFDSSSSGKGAVRLDYLSSDGQTSDGRSLSERISMHVVKSPIKDKLETLLCLIKVFGTQSTIVFLNYRDAVERVYGFLRSNGVHCEMFHGGMEQELREKSLYRFCNGTSNVLVSTDLGARGLDIPDVDNIVHYHIPLNEDAFVHRNGRTARWEAEGNSYIILNEEESVPEYLTVEPKEFFIPKNLPEIQPSEWTTVYIGKGKKDKLSKVDILGFLCKIGGLKADEVGRIDVRDHYAYVAVKRRRLRALLSSVAGQKIKGMKTIIQEAR